MSLSYVSFCGMPFHLKCYERLFKNKLLSFYDFLDFLESKVDLDKPNYDHLTGILSHYLFHKKLLKLSFFQLS